MPLGNRFGGFGGMRPAAAASAINASRNKGRRKSNTAKQRRKRNKTNAMKELMIQKGLKY